MLQESHIHEKIYTDPDSKFNIIYRLIIINLYSSINSTLYMDLQIHIYK